MVLKVLDSGADGWSGANMTPFLDHGIALSGALKGKDDYVRSVLLTELLADHLPRLPWFLRNLQCALEDSSTVLENVCTALEAHPSVRANFLRIACMAEPAQPIYPLIDQIVVVLGKERVWSTAIAAYLLNELNSTWSTIAKKAVAAIGMAHGNDAFMKACSAGDPGAEQAYVSGVLSIAGLLPLMDVSGATDKVPDWLGTSLEAIEKQHEIFGTDFLELDRWVRLLWKLPLDKVYAQTAAKPVLEAPYSAVPQKEFFTPVTAPNAEAGSRNLVLISRGTV
jgi:HD-like signal output (HDOD) protein